MNKSVMGLLAATFLAGGVAEAALLTQSTLTGGLSGSLGSPGISCSYNSGLVGASTSGDCQLANPANWGDSRYSNEVRAQAGLLSLKSEAFATTSGLGVFNSFISTTTNGTASARFSDSFQVAAAGYAGMSGNITAAFYIDGFQDALVNGLRSVTWPTGASFEDRDTNSRIDVTAQLILGSGSLALTKTDIANLYNQTDTHQAFPLMLTVSTPFLFGSDISVGASLADSLSARAKRMLSEFGGNTYVDGAATARADYSLCWGGIVSVADSSGRAVSSWSASSLSGFDYSNSLDCRPQTVNVPEPHTLALLGIASAGLLFGRRRRPDVRAE